MIDLIIRFVVIVLIRYVVWRVIRPRYAVRIVIDDQGIKYHHGLPAAHEREVLEFLQEQLSLDGKLTICANRRADGYLRIFFKGRIAPGTQQQIRNFFNSVMSSGRSPVVASQALLQAPIPHSLNPLLPETTH